MFQYVILYISSDVILFHRMRKSVRQKNGKVKGKSMAKALYPIGGREWNTRKVSPKQEKSRPERGNGRKRLERHETDKEKTVLCRVGSELSLVPASLCRSIRQEEDFVWEIC